ncbi:DUF2489 domain-containing protein [Halopseudomonas nanhaiensis]|uniref:DUF2489 domain-containing protein n=1 Tax=Halopseudomonas nanhaiensis TaxID=2830842 RepID=UPI001CBF569C|nr:DUF2489 domain-containing protein [Halopseudomonas nanhaiensis]UAW97649.1 DUF2489 domain-containing protein [Halopseudomonas nanhaiensis]
MNIFDWLAIAGLVLIVALATYAWVLWRRVWRQRQELERIGRERDERLAEDIRFLAQSLMTGQLPLIEGSIRIKVLLDNYQGTLRSGIDTEVFTLLYDATADIPTHQGWKDLPKSERNLYRQRMEQLEAEHGTRARQAAEQLGNGLT